MADIISTDPYT